MDINAGFLCPDKSLFLFHQVLDELSERCREAAFRVFIRCVMSAGKQIGDGFCARWHPRRMRDGRKATPVPAVTVRSLRTQSVWSETAATAYPTPDLGVESSAADVHSKLWCRLLRVANYKVKVNQCALPVLRRTNYAVTTYLCPAKLEPWY